MRVKDITCPKCNSKNYGRTLGWTFFCNDCKGNRNNGLAKYGKDVHKNKKWEDESKFVECYDCGRLYGGLGWIDALVTSDIWHQIGPIEDGKDAGILCINCMAKRCEILGLENVPIYFGSGPFIACKDEEERFMLDTQSRIDMGEYVGPNNMQRYKSIAIKRAYKGE